MAEEVTVSIVIPSRDRPVLLRRCVQSVRTSIERAGARAEIIVVDDGSEPPVDPREHRGVRVVRGIGEGPARARNRGIVAATGSVVAFTDDDARVSEGWFGALASALEEHPEALGVRGPVVSPPFDPLYEYSVEDRDGGRYLTCNVAYRRSALLQVGGFDPSFRFAHEDIDLGVRVAELGPILFESAMEVEHPGRPFSAREWDRRSRFVADDWLFFRRHPAYNKMRGPVALAPLRSMARRWVWIGRTSHAFTSRARFARWSRLASGQLWRAGATTLQRSRAHLERPVAPRDGLRLEGLRIAYVGPVPSRLVGGAPGVEGLILEQLAMRGCSIDCYVPTSAHFEATDDIASIEGIRVIEGRSSFRFGRWYSRTPLTKMASFQTFQALSRRRLAAVLAIENELAPYDVIYQCSSIESFGLPRDRTSLPPLVLHPSVHAAGELRWLREERSIARSTSGALRAAGVRAWMAVRAVRQRRDIQRADRVLALSDAFASLLIRDYRIDAARVAVVGNAIDLDTFVLSSEPPLLPETIVVLGRVVVRKGIEDVVALSRRLADLAGTMRMVIVGEGSLWSDYRGLLDGLEPTVASASGRMERTEIVELLGRSRLLIQASHYEPFGLTVGEALACGTPVVATQAVGAAEGLDEDICTVVPSGDVDALEAAVRTELLRPLEAERRNRCRSEVARRYGAEVIGSMVLAELHRAVEDTRSSAAVARSHP